MSIVPITFNDKNVPSAVDGGFYHAHNDDGILLGCGMTITASELIIQSGLIMACGRIIRIDGAMQIDLSEVIPSSGYLQVVLNVSPLSDPPTSLSFNTSGGAVFPALTQQDINSNPAGLYQLELAVIQVSGGNLTALTSSLLYAGLKVASPTAKGLIRPSASSGSIILSAENGNFVFRPHSWSDSTDQMVIGSSGDLSVKGKITSEDEISADYPSGDPYIHLKVNGADKGQFYYNSSNGILALNNPATDGGRINMYDTGYVYINGKNNIYIRPNSNATGEVFFDTDGQQHGGHPIKQVSAGSSTKAIANSTGWTNLASLTGLSNGVYILYGKASFSVDATADALISLCISTGNNSSSASYNSGHFTRGFTVYPSICILLSVSSSALYLNIQANGVKGTASTWYFRAVRIN